MKHMMSAALAALIYAAAGAAQAETLKVAVPHPGLWDSTLVTFAKEQGYFKDAGVDVEFFYTEGGGQQIQTVVSGSADVGLLNGLLSVMAAYDKGAPVRVISSEFIGALDSFWYARTDGPVKSLADATGRTIAYSTTGSSSHLTLLALLKQNNVQGAKPTATGGQTTTLTQVMSGQIDIGYSVPPVGMKELGEGKIRILAYGRDAASLRGQSVRVNIANAGALQSKRAEIGKLLAGFSRAIDAAYSSNDALAAMARMMNVTVEELRSIRDEFYPRAAMAMGVVKGVDEALKDAFDNKYVGKPMQASDIAGLFDLTLAPK